MTVIALHGGIGSHGEAIAAGLADELGLVLCDAVDMEAKLLDRLIPNPAWPCGSVPRRVDISAATGLSLNRWCQLVAEEIQELAAYGNVLIIGWGAAALLGKYPQISRVRVTASHDVRIRRLAAHHPRASRAQLDQAIASADAIDDFYLNWFGGGRDVSTLFGLHHDTSAQTVAASVTTILAAIGRSAGSACARRSASAAMADLATWRTLPADRRSSDVSSATSSHGKTAFTKNKN